MVLVRSRSPGDLDLSSSFIPCFRLHSQSSSSSSSSPSSSSRHDYHQHVSESWMTVAQYFVDVTLGGQLLHALDEGRGESMSRDNIIQFRQLICDGRTSSRVINSTDTLNVPGLGHLLLCSDAIQSALQTANLSSWVCRRQAPCYCSILGPVATSCAGWEELVEPIDNVIPFELLLAVLASEVDECVSFFCVIWIPWCPGCCHVTRRSRSCLLYPHGTGSRWCVDRGSRVHGCSVSRSRGTSVTK